jgi:hypothetical protein
LRAATRTPRRSSLLVVSVILVATSVLTISVLPTAPVEAAGTGTINGTVKGTVFYDRNNNAYYEPAPGSGFVADSGLAGVTVRAFDADGSLVGEATSTADGTYTLAVTGARTNDLRIEFSFDATSGPLEGFTEAIANDFAFGFQGQSFGAVRFVKVGATAVDYGMHRPSEFCRNNPSLVTCLQPDGAATGNGTVLLDGGRLFPTGSAEQSSDFRTTLVTLGAVFGIGVDPAPHRLRSATRSGSAFMGTFVKRHSEYGSAGATNTIYQVTIPRIGAGTVTPFITLPGTLPAHDATSAPGLDVPYTADTAIFSRVGRIGLGDVDVMDDGATLLAVDMDEAAPKLYFIPLEEAADGTLSPGAPAVIAIPSPATLDPFPGVSCVGTWHPMGIGTRGDRILVGGVCGAETTVSPSAPNGPHPTQSAAFVLEYTGARDGTDGDTGSGTFTTIFALDLGYERGCVYNVGCDHSTSEVGDLYTADWGAWNEYPRYNSADYSGSNPQAMLANIEITDSADLILGFRDRFADQVQTGSAAWSDAYLDGSSYTAPAFTYPKVTYNFAAGDLVRVCGGGGTLTLEQDGTCAGGLAGSGYVDLSGTSEFYFDNYPHAGATFTLHAETTNGSTATIPGYDGVWTTAYDIRSVDQQGVLIFGDCADRNGTGACFPSNSTTGSGSRIGGSFIPSSFAKGNGLADLEVLCDEAPVGFRSAIWRDLDGDGIRDVTEAGIAGVTVRLYDANGDVIATAITDVNGVFVFNSYRAMFSHIALGLTAGQEGLTIRLDNAADYALGGPLYGYYPTVTGSTTPSVFDDDTLVDSDVVLAGAGYTIGDATWPTLAIDPLAPGEHTSAFSFGMVPRVAVEGGLWIDADGDGIREDGEEPLAGVIVTLYGTDGVTPVLRADGTPATAVTAEDGSYLIDDLTPGDYRALFTLPEGYLFTTPAAGTDTSADSDPVATADPLQGMTGVFTIAFAATGDTVADTDPATRAAFVNPTISAGVVQVVAMGDYVWIDVDGDGVQDADEPPLQGVVVTLYNADGTRALDADGLEVAPATTDAAGYYLIDNLLPGEYFATFTLPPGYAFTITGAGTSATDSNPSPTDADPSIGTTALFTITSAVSGDTIADEDPTTRARFINPTIDAGVTTSMVSLGGTLWTDTDGDAVLDTGESPLAGLTVRITDLDGQPVLDAFGDPVDDVVTSADGSYRFDRLPMGTYLVSVVDPPAGTRATLPAGATSWSVELLVGGAHRSGLDFAYAPAAAGAGPRDDGGSSEGGLFADLIARLPIPRSIPAGLDPSLVAPLGAVVAGLLALLGLTLQTARHRRAVVVGGQLPTTPSRAALRQLRVDATPRDALMHPDGRPALLHPDPRRPLLFTRAGAEGPAPRPTAVTSPATGPMPHPTGPSADPSTSDLAPLLVAALAAAVLVIVADVRRGR